MRTKREEGDAPSSLFQRSGRAGNRRFSSKISEELERDPALQKNLHIFIKNRENRLDISKIFFYDNKARVEGRTVPSEYCDEPGDCSKEVTSGEYVR